MVYFADKDKKIGEEDIDLPSVDEFLYLGDFAFDPATEEASGDMASFGELIRNAKALGMYVTFTFMIVKDMGFTLVYSISNMMQNGVPGEMVIPIPKVTKEKQLIVLMKKGLIIAIMRQNKELKRKEQDENPDR